MPQQELLETYLRKPITLVPDTTGRAENYARGNEKDVEEKLPIVGIYPEYLYQAQRYRSSLYAEQMKKALECKQQIIDTFGVSEEKAAEMYKKTVLHRLCIYINIERTSLQ